MDKIAITKPIDSLWTNEDQPQFIERTKTTYSKMPLSALKDRGIENRLFDSLVAGLPEGCVIAGGFMTNLLLEEKNGKDVDIFCCSERAFREVCNLLLTLPAQRGEEEKDEKDDLWAYRGYQCQTDIEKFEKNSKETRFLKFTHEKRIPIQIMKMYWYTDAEHVIDTFDLTIAQVGADREFIYCNPLTPLDLARKRIVLHRMQFPASTIRRIIKYASKGFYACPGSLVNIATEIQQHPGMKDIDEASFVYVD